MNTIEIATAHNIVFRYELASTVKRFLAYAIDWFIVIVGSSLILGLLSSFYSFATIVVTVLAMSYHLLFEMFNQGQSPGKMLVKLRVVTLKGATPTPFDYLLRWVFRLVDIVVSGGAMAILMISSTERNQRVGDILAQTTVISLQNNLGISLESLNSFNTDQNILYPGVVKYNDDDMLLLKMSINRYLRYPNEKNVKVLEVLTDKFAAELELKDQNVNIEFLKRILSDYIILTR